VRVAAILVFALISGHSTTQKVQQNIPEKTRILFLLDASGSMLASWKDEYRIDVAKRILTNMVDSLRGNNNLELALRVYGHMYFRKSQNCTDSRLEVPFRPGNHDQIIKKLKDIKPKGTTPIAYSLEQSANDFPEQKGYRNIIVLITDGLESCDGDPCAVSLALQQKGIFLKPFVIGIGGLNSEFDKEFSCIGQYYNAEDDLAFKEALQKVIETTLATTTATVELQDNRGSNKYSNVNVTFENEFTGTPAFDFIHYLDANKNPDTVEVDPVLIYNMVVHTLPPVIKRRLEIKPGKHNHIALKTPQGHLQVNQKNAKSYRKTVEVIMKKKSGEIFYVQEINSSQQYLAGNYEAVITTLPRRTFQIIISEGKTTLIDIPGPGIVNFFNSNRGYGSIYEIKSDNSQEWVGELKPVNSRSSWVLQPGNYKMVFRSELSRGSKFTSIKYFTVTSGASVGLQLP
jgi:Ca-activated chloride channel family protein